MLTLELHLDSAKTGKRTTLCRAKIANIGGETLKRSRGRRGDYQCVMYDKNGKPWRMGRVDNWPRKSRHVWELVLTAIQSAISKK